MEGSKDHRSLVGNESAENSSYNSASRSCFLQSHCYIPRAQAKPAGHMEQSLMCVAFVAFDNDPGGHLFDGAIRDR